MIVGRPIFNNIFKTPIFSVRKLTERLGNPDKPSFVCKSSKLKRNSHPAVDRTEDHVLSQRFVFFDEKVNRCKELFLLTPRVSHRLFRRYLPFSTMECENKD